MSNIIDLEQALASDDEMPGTRSMANRIRTPALSILQSSERLRRLSHDPVTQLTAGKISQQISETIAKLDALSSGQESCLFELQGLVTTVATASQILLTMWNAIRAGGNPEILHSEEIPTSATGARLIPLVAVRPESVQVP